MQNFTKVSLPAAVKITCLCTCRFVLVYSCRSVSSQRWDEWQSHLVQICLSAESSQRMKRSTDVEKGPKSQKLDRSRDLILLCEAPFHVANDGRVCVNTYRKQVFIWNCTFGTSKTTEFNAGTICTLNIFKTIWIIQSFSRSILG